MTRRAATTLGSQRCVWHWRTKTFRGDHILDLYSTQAAYPELFDGYKAKYETTIMRRFMLGIAHPKLGKLWNEVIHTSTIHPQLVADAKRSCGIPHEPTDYFVIPVERLRELGLRCALWTYPPLGLYRKGQMFTNNLLHKLGVGPDGLLGQDVYEWLDFDNYRSLDTMPEYAMNKYRGWGAEIKEGKHPQILTYDGVPHLFVDGKIPTEGLEVITVD